MMNEYYRYECTYRVGEEKNETKLKRQIGLNIFCIEDKRTEFMIHSIRPTPGPLRRIWYFARLVIFATHITPITVA